MEHRSQREIGQRQHPDNQEGEIAQHHHRHVGAAQRDRGGFHADAQVVVTIDHRVFGVIGQHPEQVAK